MKKILIYLSVLLLGTVISCQKFLEEEYLSGENSNTVFQSEEGFESLVSAAYLSLRAWYGKENGWDLTESGTDIYTWGLDNRSKGFCTYSNFVDEEQTRTAAIWYELYVALNTCNLILKNVDEVPYDDVSLRDMRKGEVYFLRAHYLYLIVETWGNVHFTTEPTEEADKTANRTPISTFYQQIFSDLEAALPLVPEMTTEYGRVDKQVVRAFLARTNLTWASYLENGFSNGTQTLVEQDAGQAAQYYNKAFEYAEDIISSGYYGLLDNWDDIWDIDNIKNEEIIWVVNYSDDPVYTRSNLRNPWDEDFTEENKYPETEYDQAGHRLIQREGGHQGHVMWEIRYENLSWGLVRDVNNGRGFQRWMPTRHFIDMYNENLDERFFGSFKNVWYANDADATPVWRPTMIIDGQVVLVPQEKWVTPLFDIGDTAIYFSKTPVSSSVKAKFSATDIYSFNSNKGYLIFDINDMYLPDGTPNNAIINRQYYFPITKKYQDTTRLELAQAYSKRDCYVIRLAEIYLIASEAAMMTGNSAEAYSKLLTLANARAYNGNGAELLGAYGVNSGSDISIDFLLDERARELATEFLRYFDLKRTNKLVERLTLYNTDAAPNIQQYHNVRFIPQEQIDAVFNKDEFMQNPGYQ
jgi:hypothetical protein